jgi:LmbE family N-acetylglucosaminyl deacetylase
MTDLALLAALAHPDDETFRPGGTLALLARQGVRVQVLSATRGEAGSCGDPPRCTPEELPAVRTEELRCACAVLGLAPARLLKYPDGYLREADPEALSADILDLIAEVNPQVMLTFGPDGLSGHRDHVVIGELAKRAFNRSATVASLYTLAVPASVASRFSMSQVQPVPDEDIGLRVDVSSVWDLKRAAMDCHATQRSSTPMLTAPEITQRLFFGREYFVCTTCRNAELDFLPKLLHGYCL